STACNLSSAVYLTIKKLHLQLLDVSNNWGAVHIVSQGFFTFYETFEEVKVKVIRATERRGEVTDKRAKATERKAEVTDKTAKTTERRGEVTDKRAKTTERRGDATDKTAKMTDKALEMTETKRING
ncbi:hypothetical protein, partial [Lysinibacillus sp. NPDC093688]|uniref:hypothetical protein n=1 Tax=Lysinibacillus sp. NPDC093688 TaxID=3390577 RepID=UPI003D045C9B